MDLKAITHWYQDVIFKGAICLPCIFAILWMFLEFFVAVTDDFFRLDFAKAPLTEKISSFAQDMFVRTFLLPFLALIPLLILWGLQGAAWGASALLDFF